MDHLLGDRERFIAALGAEWETVASTPLPGEALVESVHPSDSIARLNLRPAKAAGLPLAELGPLLADQTRRRGQREALVALWDEAVALAREGRIPFRRDELETWGELLQAGTHPPGHSAPYRELNQPAYRLVHNISDPGIRRVLARAGLEHELP